MRITDVQKPASLEEELFLSSMVDAIMLYNVRLDQLENLYNRIECRLIAPCYFNFRDALFHYAKAYESHEIIQLHCEQNAMQEHLHRALKDGCIGYLQLLNERLDILYRYTCSDERLEKLNEHLEIILHRVGWTRDDFLDAGKDIRNLNKELDGKISTAEFQLICEVIFNVRFGTPCKHKKLLQKTFHALRNLELDSRSGSMHISKPFSIKVNKATGKAPIDLFFETCDNYFVALQKAELEDFIILAKVLQNPVVIE